MKKNNTLSLTQNIRKRFAPLICVIFFVGLDVQLAQAQFPSPAATCHAETTTQTFKQ
jgi:hypothetical protein